jgi:hypothetical protein
MEFVVDKVSLGQVFPLSTLVFPCQFHSTGTPLQGKTKNLIIFIIGLHNKLQGCGAFVASAAGPFTKKTVYSKNVECSSSPSSSHKKNARNVVPP